MKSCLLVFLLLLATISQAQESTLLTDYTNNGMAITAGFIPDSTRIVLGEPLLITFVLTNRSSQPFPFSHVRQSVFTLTATNADGEPVKLHNRSLDANGIISTTNIPPERAYIDRLLLNYWCIFEQPGVYKVTCRCDMNFSQTRADFPRQPVISTFELTILPPDRKRMAEIIKGWGQVIETNGPVNEAALALAEINDPQTIPYLTLLVTQPRDINYQVVNALARFTNNPAAADALIKTLHGNNDYIAQIAGGVLRDFKQADRAVQTLLPGLTNSDPTLRIQAIRAISFTGSELAFDPLVDRLKDEDNSVRCAAAEATGRLGDPRSFAKLEECLNETDFAFRLAAVRGMIALKQPVQVAWVKPIIESGGENVRTYYDAIDLLRMHGGDQAATGLASCLHFDDPSVNGSHNMRILLALESTPKGPKYYYKWHHDPNRTGTEQELTDNRQILAETKVWLSRQK